MCVRVHARACVRVWVCALTVCVAAGTSWVLVCTWAGRRLVWPYWEGLCSAAPAGSRPPPAGKHTHTCTWTDEIFLSHDVFWRSARVQTIRQIKTRNTNNQQPQHRKRKYEHCSIDSLTH